MSVSARITSAVSVALLAFAVIVLASLSSHGGTGPVIANTTHLQAAAADATATPTASATTDGIIWD